MNSTICTTDHEHLASCTPRLLLGYARVSTDRVEGSKEQTLGQQLDVLTGYGVATSDIYSEKISGTINLVGGKQFAALEKRIIESVQPVELVLVDWTRYSRDAIDFLWTLRKQVRLGCVFTIVGDPRYQRFAPSGSMDYLILAFESFFAQMTTEKTSKSTKAKLHFLQKQGVSLGRPEKIGPEDHKAIKQLSADGWGAGRIAEELTKRRTAAIPAETKLIPVDYEKAVKHARVSKGTISPILRKNINSREVV